MKRLGLLDHPLVYKKEILPLGHTNKKKNNGPEEVKDLFL
jgi:hypothetical protein